MPFVRSFSIVNFQLPIYNCQFTIAKKFGAQVMNLVKWLRKNQSKVMAIVVIGTLVGFIGGSALTYLLSPGRTAGYKAVAYFGENKKITNYELISARNELDILRMLQMEQVLRSQDLQGILLGELVFSDTRVAPAVINYVKQMIRANGYRISDEQLRNIYKRSLPSDIYWILLKKEAGLAGIRISNEDVGRLLGTMIPRLLNGVTYSQFIGSLVNQRGIPEKRLLETVGELEAVWQYAELVCSTENVTNSQLSHLASWQNETVNVEFVRFNADAFVQSSPAQGPVEQELLEHFNKYKEFFAGDITEQNPYGFGYKLPARVQLEYIAVKLDDVSSIVTVPAPQETEEYYRKHAKEFTKSVPSDPNDPNSPALSRTKSYAEVAGAISEQLMQDRVHSKADSILREAKTLTEAGLQDIDSDIDKLSPEQLKQKAGAYKTAAEQLGKKHNLKIYSGQTGLLSLTDMQMDEYLDRLFVTGYGYRPVPLKLNQIIFMVGNLDTGAAELLDLQKPRMYENIGPVQDLSEKIMAMVRIVDAENASQPDTIDCTFSKGTLELDQKKPRSNEAAPEQDRHDANTPPVYSVKEKVVEDVKRLAAMGAAQNKAKEFVRLVAENGWDGALSKLNDLYRQQRGQTGQAKQTESEPNTFRLENLTNLRRIPSSTLEALVVQSGGNPEEKLFVREAAAPKQWFTVNETRIESRFVEQLYSLVPQDSNTAPSLPVSIEFKPHMSLYVIKNISINRLSQQDYEKVRAAQAYREDHLQNQNLAVIHFNPENIVKRMNFRSVNQSKEPASADAPAEPEEP
jgi:hypothetical protein